MTAILLLITAIIGTSFVGMQAFSGQIDHDCKALGKSFFASIWISFYGYWFPWFYVSIGVLFLFIVLEGWRGL